MEFELSSREETERKQKRILTIKGTKVGRTDYTAAFIFNLTYYIFFGNYFRRYL